jgi:hypothetical protein
MSMDPQRRSALLATKVVALVRDHVGPEQPLFPGAIGGGAAVMRAGEAWVLADETPSRFLGPAMAWAGQQGATALHLLAESEAGQLARRAGRFKEPPTVWAVSGRELSLAAPSPLPAPASIDPRVIPLMEVITAAGATPVVEHGVLTGEVIGLEVCRAIVDPHVDVVRLEVGVGVHDREAFTLLHGDVPTPEALAKVVNVVRQHRLPRADPHPLNRLAPERALRARLVSEPGLVGLASLSEAPPPLARAGVEERWPAVAVGVDEAGRSTVVVCSHGIDLDLVPYATDACGVGDRLIIALPRRDAHPITVMLAQRLREPAEVIGVAEI